MLSSTVCVEFKHVRRMVNGFANSLAKQGVSFIGHPAVATVLLLFVSLFLFFCSCLFGMRLLYLLLSLV